MISLFSFVIGVLLAGVTGAVLGGWFVVQGIKNAQRNSPEGSR